jgi:hypothetical protein
MLPHISVFKIDSTLEIFDIKVYKKKNSNINMKKFSSEKNANIIFNVIKPKNIAMAIKFIKYNLQVNKITDCFITTTPF